MIDYRKPRIESNSCHFALKHFFLSGSRGSNGWKVYLQCDNEEKRKLFERKLFEIVDGRFIYNENELERKLPPVCGPSLPISSSAAACGT